MTDEEVDRAIAVAAKEADLPAACTAQYLPETRLLLICLKSGQRLAVPVEDLEDIKDATDDALSQIELIGFGTSIHFTKFGHGVYVPYVAEGAYGSDKWMKQLKEKYQGALQTADALQVA